MHEHQKKKKKKKVWIVFFHTHGIANVLLVSTEDFRKVELTMVLD